MFKILLTDLKSWRENKVKEFLFGNQRKFQKVRETEKRQNKVSSKDSKISREFTSSQNFCEQKVVNDVKDISYRILAILR